MSTINKIYVKKPRKSAINLSYQNLFTANFGELIPFYIQDDVLPGDQFRVNAEMLIRCSPLVAPAMVAASAYAYYFFIPNRILWDDWTKFISPENMLDPEEELVFPQFKYADNDEFNVSTLYDYLYNIRSSTGKLDKDVRFSQLPMRAYKLVWNEYFRNQNIQDEIDIPRTGGVTPVYDPDSKYTSGDLLYHNWHKDYFTSALPWSQRGGEVTIPLGQAAPLIYDSKAIESTPTSIIQNGFRPAGVFIGPDGKLVANKLERLSSDGGTISNNMHEVEDNDSVNIYVPAYDQDQLTPSTVRLDVSGYHHVDLSEASATTINDLRRAIKLQAWLENSARGGGRYVEAILSHFGVRVPDYTVHRPVYLGGGKIPIQFSEVLQMAPSASEPTGTMAGHGVGVGGSPGFKKFYAREHGIILGIMTLQPKAIYMNAARKQIFKNDKFDFYWPEFQHLGEQPIECRELYPNQADTSGLTEFGYTPRYAEYLYRNSEVHGYMATNQSYWHLGRATSVATKLSNTFIQMTPAQGSRIFAVQSVQQSAQFNVMLYNKVRALRPINKYANPSIW